MVLGLVAGAALNAWSNPQARMFNEVVWWLDLFGKDLFIGLLMMIIAPLILASIITGISTLPNMKELGAVGWKTLAYYIVTTSVAVAIGLVAVLLLQPGYKDASRHVRLKREIALDAYRQKFREQHEGADPLAPENRSAYLTLIARHEGQVAATELASKWERIERAGERGPGDIFRNDILRPLLTNPFASLAQVPPNSLGIIFFAILVGLACIVIGAPARPVVTFFQGLNEVMMTITLWVMHAAPVAIGCIIASMVARLGMLALQSLAWYCATVITGIAIHVALLTFLVWALGRRSPLEFWRGIWSAWLIAFSTTSSAATLPVTIKCVIENLKVSPKIANFTLPIGATVNMDGTALYEGVAVIFMIQLYGGLDDVNIQLTAANTFIIFITAVLASIGAAAVPSAGLVTMAIVASAVGLPLYYIAFIYAVDHFLDMFRTSTNVLGDAVGAVIIDAWEGKRLEASDLEPPVAAFKETEAKEA